MNNEYDILQIMKRLPHRYPFLLIDRVLNIEPDKSIEAIKNVTMNEHFFQGHFPAAPVMPGVLIVEAMAQAGGVLAYESMPPGKEMGVIYFMGIDKVRFRKPVVPGDRLLFRVEILKVRGKVVKMAGRAFVDGEKVAEGEMMATLGD